LKLLVVELVVLIVHSTPNNEIEMAVSVKLIEFGLFMATTN